MNWLKTVYFNNEYNEKLMFDVTNTIKLKFGLKEYYYQKLKKYGTFMLIPIPEIGVLFKSVNNKIFVSTENVR